MVGDDGVGTSVVDSVLIFELMLSEEVGAAPVAATFRESVISGRCAAGSRGATLGDARW